MKTYEFADKRINPAQLNRELHQARIMCLGSARYSRREIEGVWQPADPYIVVKMSRTIVASRVATMSGIVAAHIAVDDVEIESVGVQEFREAVTIEDKITALARHLQLVR